MNEIEQAQPERSNAPRLTPPRTTEHAALTEWITTKPGTKFVSCLITLKLERRFRTLPVRQPARDPLVRNERVIGPVRNKWRIAEIDSSHVQNVRPRGRAKPLSVHQAWLYDVNGTKRQFLPDDEPADIASRMMFRLNRDIFGGKARRRKDPLRLAGVVAVHDLSNGRRRCRPHLHAVIQLPEHTTLEQMQGHVLNALRPERFASRKMTVELAITPLAAVRYLINPNKSSTGSPVVYLNTGNHEPPPSLKERMDERKNDRTDMQIERTREPVHARSAPTSRKTGAPTFERLHPPMLGVAGAEPAHAV